LSVVHDRIKVFWFFFSKKNGLLWLVRDTEEDFAELLGTGEVVV
jgi:hypothetical protein